MWPFKRNKTFLRARFFVEAKSFIFSVVKGSVELRVVEKRWKRYCKILVLRISLTPSKRARR
jgi:hypothetical protein